MGLLIPGPKAVTSNHLDVYLGPLVEELKELWTEGVLCYDAARWRGKVMYTLRAIMLWCVHDFPAYAMLAGTTNKGYHACPVCGADTHLRYPEPLSKVVYGGRHQRWLPQGHPFRFNTSVFPTQEVEATPVPMYAANHIRWAFFHAEYARFRGRIGGEDEPTLCSGVKRLPTFYSLPYWKVYLH